MTEPRRLRRLLAVAVAVLALAGTACAGDDDTEVAGTTRAGVATTADRTTRTTQPSTTPSPVAPSVEVPPAPYAVATPVREGQLAIYDQPFGAVARSLQHPRLINDDPNAPVPLSLLVKQRTDDGWLEVYLPVRPNGTTGWVRATDVTTASHDYRIEVELSAYRLTLYDGDDVALIAPLAVAAANTPTPGGLYYTTELIRPPDAPNGPYGTYAYGLSGYSDALTSFNGGPGQLGIHGTNQPGLMGQNVSHGCIRMRNEDIDRLAEDIGLPLGVPVVVIA